MSEPFLAEVRMVGFNYPPRGWAFLDGQILPISQNQSLYSLLGSTYGGDGRSTFALPDLRGRTPMHADDGHALGQKSGEEQHSLSLPEMPSHTHGTKATLGASNSASPDGTLFAQEAAPDLAYGDLDAARSSALRGGTLANAGGGQPHDNMQPFLALNFCIALQGLFPSRT